MPFDISGARQAGYSDEEITGFLGQQNPNFDVNGAAKAGYKPDEIANFLAQTVGAKPKEEKQSTLSRIGQDETTDFNNSAKEITEPFTPDTSAGPNWLQKIGKYGSAIGGALMSPFKSLAKETVGEGLADTVSNVALKATEVDHPELTQGMTSEDRKVLMDKLHNTSKDVIGSSVANATLATAGTAGQLGEFKSVNAIKQGIRDKTPDSVTDFLNDTRSGPIKEPAPMPQGFDTLAEANKDTGPLAKSQDPSVAGLKANQGLSKAYDKANVKAEALYTAQKALGQGETTSANDISEPLSKTINDLEQSAVTSQQTSTLRRLKAVQEKYFSGDNVKNTSASGMSVAGESVAPKAQEIELNDLVELKQALNEGFKSNDFTKSSDIPLVKLNNAIKDKISSLKDTHPDFVSAGKQADEFYGKEVARKFKDNSQLDSMWQPEDYYAWKETQNPEKYPGARGVTDATVTRAGKFLDSLNSGDEGRVSSLIQALPREEAIQVLHDAIIQAKSVTPSLRNVALNLLGKSGNHGTVGTPIYSAEMALRNLLGVIKSPMTNSPLVDLANRVTPEPGISPTKAAATAGLSYLGYKSFGNKRKNIPEKGANDVQPQSNNAPINATNSALIASKKNDGFNLDNLNPISNAEASEIKVPENSPISGNVKEFKTQDKGSLQAAMKKHGVSSTEMMTLINAESSVKKITGNGYAQITPGAWKQAEKVSGQKFNRNNSDDYAEAAVTYYKWTAQQVKDILKLDGTPSVKDVYPAYNAGIAGFKALHKASPTEKSVNVVPKDVSENNRTFYYDKSGNSLTVRQTLQAYRNFINTKMNEYAPSTPAKATKLALNQARTDNEPDMEPYGK